MLGILKSLKVTASTFFRRPVTIEYPEVVKTLPPRARGFPLLVWEHEHNEPVCIGCRLCDRYCPVDCITVIGPMANPHYPKKDHNENACRTANGVCEHTSPRSTAPERFIIDFNRCMLCGICEEVCPTDQPRYGNKKAIVLGTGHIRTQSSVLDRGDNILDLYDLTYHSRILNLELNEVQGQKPPKKDIAVNSCKAAGLRLSGWPSVVPSDRPIPVTSWVKPSLKTRAKARLLKYYAPAWLWRRGQPLKTRPPTTHDRFRRSKSDSWPSIGELLGKKNGKKD